MGKNILEIREELQQEFKAGVRFIQPDSTEEHGVYTSTGEISFNPYHCFYTSGGGILYKLIEGSKAKKIYGT
jgi:hypothetical protein